VVSELGAGESNDGDGSSLECGGTGNLDPCVFVTFTNSSGASVPSGFEFNFGTFAIFAIECFMDNTSLGVAGGKGGESVLVNLISSSPSDNI